VVGMVVNDVVDFVRQKAELLCEFVKVNESNALNVSKDFLLLVLEVVKSNDVLSEEGLINAKDGEVLQDFKSEGQLVSGAVNDWSVLDSSLGSVEPTHEDAANHRVHVG
jgi:hypothetical protein